MTKRAPRRKHVSTPPPDLDRVSARTLLPVRTLHPTRLGSVLEGAVETLRRTLYMGAPEGLHPNSTCMSPSGAKLVAIHYRSRPRPWDGGSVKVRERGQGEYVQPHSPVPLPRPVSARECANSILCIIFNHLKARGEPPATAAGLWLSVSTRLPKGSRFRALHRPTG